MRQAKWKDVETGDFLIWADEYEGVHRVMVTEIDIKLWDPGPPARWAYPYGLTKEGGTIKARLDPAYLGDVRVMNLRDLIPYSDAALTALEKAWRLYQQKKAIEEEYKQEYLTVIKEDLEES